MKSNKINISDSPNLKYSIHLALLKYKDILYQPNTTIFSKKKMLRLIHLMNYFYIV